MNTRVRETLSSARKLSGGSPQGSILGNFLFCITTDWMERDADFSKATRDQEGRLAGEDLGLRGLASRVRESPIHPGPPPANQPRFPESIQGPVRRSSSRIIRNGPPAHSTPSIRGQFATFAPDIEDDEGQDDSIRFFRLRRARVLDDTKVQPRVSQEQLDAASGTIPTKWEDKDMLVIKYIDDFNGVEKVFKDNPIMTITSGKTEAEVKAIKSKVLYAHVQSKAGDIQMRVNAKKTQMLCITSSHDKVFSTTM